MSNLLNAILGPGQLGPPGLVPSKVAHLKRFPFILLIDVSGSTALGPSPDIDHINNALSVLLGKLRNPDPSSDLARKQAQIDLLVVAYNDTPRTVLPWTCANALPASLPPLSGDGCTATGAALHHAINEIWSQLKSYGGVGTPCGMPHIIHLTDGQPTDISVGSPSWNELKDRLTRIDGSQREKAYARLINFISPRGLISTPGSGQSGQAIISELTGADTVHPMGSGVDKFEQLVKTITLLVSYISSGFDAKSSVKNAIDLKDDDGAS